MVNYILMDQEFDKIVHRMDLAIDSKHNWRKRTRDGSREGNSCNQGHLQMCGDGTEENWHQALA